MTDQATSSPQAAPQAAPQASLVPDSPPDSPKPVKITAYRWAGQWGPFKITIPCGECALTLDVLRDVAENELEGVPLAVETRDWLSNWWKPFFRGGGAWHAPIVMVENKVVSQGEALNRGLITQEVARVWASRAPMTGDHLFGKDNCGHCRRAKAALEAAGIDFTYHDVVRSPRAMYEMLARVKPIVGSKTPITTPQIWLGGEYIGGADALDAHLIKHGLASVADSSESGEEGKGEAESPAMA